MIQSVNSTMVPSVAATIAFFCARVSGVADSSTTRGRMVSMSVSVSLFHECVLLARTHTQVPEWSRRLSRQAGWHLDPSSVWSRTLRKLLFFRHQLIFYAVIARHVFHPAGAFSFKRKSIAAATKDV